MDICGKTRQMLYAKALPKCILGGLVDEWMDGQTNKSTVIGGQRDRRTDYGLMDLCGWTDGWLDGSSLCSNYDLMECRCTPDQRTRWDNQLDDRVFRLINGPCKRIRTISTNAKYY